MFDSFQQKPLYFSKFGKAYVMDSLVGLKKISDNSVDLVITSPPFALLRKKEYGNEDQNVYVDWLMQFGYEIKRVLKETGSLVIDLGGSYKKGRPVRSLYNYRVLIRFCDDIGFNLAEEFFWHNPSKLPSPIEWVNKRKIRVKDSVNTVWWFSKSDFPKADVKKILSPYSERMKKLIKDQEKYYTPKKRPSGHNISKSFSKNNGGSIPPNLLQIPNSESNTQYLRFCKQLKIKSHPARFPEKLPEFFIKYLTDENDIVIDIFSGSNTTGKVCETLQRKWISFDLSHEYLAASVFRFLDSVSIDDVFNIYNSLLKNKETNYELIYDSTIFDFINKE
ncbi:MAG: site-specific DNA-methyltransferase [Candidatus Cloacimonetes bacterium]|nr:site-specific DNA-methyltransferase [Candidatus Cloacimonadota bacterium]